MSATYFGSPDFQDPRQPQAGGDLLGTFSIPVGQTIASFDLAQTLGSYQRILVQGSSSNSGVVTCYITDTWTAYEWQYSRYCTGVSNFAFAVPTFGVVGDTQLNVILQVQNAVTGVPMTFNCYGLRYFETGFRYDALQPVQGQFFANTGVSGAGSVVVVPAPGGGERILISNFWISSGGAGGNNNTQLSWTMNGTTQPWGGIDFSINDIYNQDYGNGVLVDFGSGITYNTFDAGTTNEVGINYDIVHV